MPYEEIMDIYKKIDDTILDSNKKPLKIKFKISFLKTS